MKLNWNLLRGGGGGGKGEGSNQKTLHVGGMNIIWNYTFHFYYAY